MATIYYTDGRTKQVEPENGHDFSLDELKNHVEYSDNSCKIELVWMHKTKSLLVIDEEGKLKNLHYNWQATNLWHTSEGYRPDTIVGNALHCRIDEIE